MPDKSPSNNEKIAELFRNYSDYLYNYAITRVNDTHVAEDLVQETFISALKGYDSFQSKSKESTWLIAILKNKIIDHYRKKSKHYFLQSLDEMKTMDDFFNSKGAWQTDQRPSRWDVDVDNALEQQEFYEILQQCLVRLNDIQRMAFVMKHLDDEDTNDICKELEITSTNYWVIIHRAKLQLRKCMETNWVKL
ncbi:MAG: sigma-70 family RNA polymerase sigma factor [Bacteroidales bacterium]|nr:sigma-70 family RNA polymerase sigma factor [Bacteroidales bacterium]